jgi:hypothetical protein
MTFKKIGVAACITIAGGLYACSSTSTTGGSPSDGGGTVYKPLEAGSTGDDDNTGDDAGSNGPGVGNACTTSGDCANDAGPAGQCSSDNFFAAGPLFPTAVCLSKNCVVPSDPNEIGICGNNDLPGLCQAGENGSPSVCFPLCLVSGAGAVSGCLTNDACKVAGTTSDPTTNATELIGMCQPGCTADSQCPTGTKCDTYQSVCVATPTVFTTPFGSTCDPTTTTTCLCIGTTGSTTGFCSSQCVTGSGACPAAPAGDGGADGGAALPYVCSAQLGGINAADAGFDLATQPNGLGGYCFQACNTAADCTLAGSVCNPDPAGAPHTGICALQ